MGKGGTPPAIPPRLKSITRLPEDQIKFKISKSLDEAVTKGLETYNETLDEFIGGKLLITDSDFEKFHDEAKNQVTEAFQNAYAFLHTTDYSGELELASIKMEEKIHSKWIVNKTRFHNVIDDILRAVKSCTDDAFQYYETEMGEFMENPGEDVTLAHKAVEERTLTKFKSLLKAKGVKKKSSYYIEIKARLAERLQEMQEEIQEENNFHHQTSPNQSLINLQIQTNVDQSAIAVSYESQNLVDSIIPPEPENGEIQGRDPFDTQWLQSQGLRYPGNQNSIMNSSLNEPLVDLELPGTPTQPIRDPAGVATFAPHEAAISTFVLQDEVLPPEIIPTQRHSTLQDDEPILDLFMPNDQKLRPKLSVEGKNYLKNPSPKKQAPAPPKQANQEATSGQILTRTLSNISDGSSSSGADDHSLQGTPSGHVRYSQDSSTNSNANQAVSENTGPRSSRTPSVGGSLNIGICIDEESIQIGNYEEDQLRILLRQTYPIRLSFTDPKISSQPIWRDFNLHTLIKSTSNLLAIQFNVKVVHVEVKHILARVFKQIFIKILKEAKTYNLGAVVLTTPFSLTSAEKERLKKSLEISGGKNIRILTSLISSMLVHTKRRIPSLEEKQKRCILLFICHPLNFVMGVVKIRKNKMVTQAYQDSNYLPSRTSEFDDAYLRLMNNTGTNDLLLLTKVKEVLHEAWRYILKVVTKTAIHQIVISTPVRSNLSHLLDDLFSHTTVEKFHQNTEPLLGVSIFASKKLPQYFQIFDSHRPKLTLFVNGKVEKEISKKQDTKDGFVFQHFHRLESQEIRILVVERFHKSQPRILICGYQVTGVEFLGEDEKASIHCRVDEDGVYSVSVRLCTSSSTPAKVTRDDKLMDEIEADSKSVNSVRRGSQVVKKRFSRLANGVVRRVSSFRRSEDLPAGVEKSRGSKLFR